VIAGRYLGLVKFEHTLFAMPFALMSLLVATQGRPDPHILLWVVVAMVGARSAAMAFNRLADRHLDAHNPRTSARHIPAGEVTPRGATVFTLVAAAVLVFAASRLNTLCFALSPVALLVVLGYSYTKRITRWAHLVLGLGLAVAPVGAWLAATGSFATFPLWLAAAVMVWVGGFDVIYACQDIDFDRHEGLHSVPVAFGVTGALRTARILHVLSVACLAMAFLSTPVLGPASMAGVVVMAVLLIQEHRLVRGGDLSRIDKAFFVINSWIGAAVLGCVLIDLYLV
jgi:4-hydroxybenzoate polyprenyltransferase